MSAYGKFSRRFREMKPGDSILIEAPRQHVDVSLSGFRKRSPYGFRSQEVTEGVVVECYSPAVTAAPAKRERPIAFLDVWKAMDVGSRETFDAQFSHLAESLKDYSKRSGRLFTLSFSGDTYTVERTA